MPSPDLTITAVAQRAGIRPSAIRYYESIGLLPVPARINGRRRYDARVSRRLTIIAAAQGMGFTLAEIATLCDGFSADTPASARWRVFAAEKRSSLDALISSAEGMKQRLDAVSRCDCPTLDACADALAGRPSVVS
ncbi:MAG: MerR family transcriptional regulator [Chloroflexota bacterium]|nr:MerR family transcriptional regulator [Chloroflexota bacterium]